MEPAGLLWSHYGNKVLLKVATLRASYISVQVAAERLLGDLFQYSGVGLRWHCCERLGWWLVVDG